MRRLALTVEALLQSLALRGIQLMTRVLHFRLKPPVMKAGIVFYRLGRLSLRSKGDLGIKEDDSLALCRPIYLKVFCLQEWDNVCS